MTFIDIEFIFCGKVMTSLIIGNNNFLIKL